jgi:hypothetical protein
MKARRFALAPYASRSYRLRYGVRARAEHPMKNVLLAGFVASAENVALVRRTVLPRRQRSSCPAHTTPAGKQTP